LLEEAARSLAEFDELFLDTFTDLSAVLLVARTSDVETFSGILGIII